MNKWFEYERMGFDKIKPLFMWAGGKNKVIKYYRDTDSLIDVHYKNYCEPFFGGGAMLLEVLKKTFISDRIVINDINDGIIRIYKAIKYDVDNFIQEMNKLESIYILLDYDARKKLYFDIRKEHAWEYEKWEDEPTIEAVHLYFLMKTGFNGIWQVNKNTNGRFGTPAGLLTQSKRVYDESNILLWSTMLNERDIEIYCEDWRNCVERVEDDNTFFFLDPPYRGGFTKYGEDFGDDKQIELVDFCKSLKKSTVFLCNRDLGDGFFEERKDDLKIRKFNITYTAGRRKKTKNGFEAMPAKEILLYKI